MTEELQRALVFGILIEGQRTSEQIDAVLNRTVESSKGSSDKPANFLTRKQAFYNKM